MILCRSVTYLFLAAALCSCAPQPAAWEGRWGGYWGDGIYDSIALTNAADGAVEVSYWRDVDADDVETAPDIPFQVANLAQPLLLQWDVQEYPGARIVARYVPQMDRLEVQISGPNLYGVNVMHRHGQALPPHPALEPRAGTQAHIFSLHAPWASEVYLAGEMNDWHADDLPMTKDNDGTWHLTLHLEPGRWQYKYVVDGRWQPDPLAPSARAGLGDANSLLTLGSPDPRYDRDPAIAAGTVEEVVVQSRHVSEQRVLIYRPAGMHEKPLPWLLLLHGYGEDRHQWLDDGQLPNLLDHLISSGEMPPLAVVMPDGGTSFYQGDTEKYLMEELLPAAGGWGLSSDPRQRAISGMSMGGFGAFYLSYRHPQAFTAALPLSGYFDFSRLPTLDVAQVGQGYHLEFWCGSQDSISTATNQLLALRLAQTAQPPQFHYRDGGHTWRYWQTIMPEVLKRTAEQLYQVH